jgi:hypothetical protein
VTAGGGISGGGTSGTVTVSHADTSSQASVNNSGATVIQDVTLDTYGHVTGLASKTLTAADVGAAASSHTHNYAGAASSGGAAYDANAVVFTGYGNGEFTAQQTSGNWQTWTGGWATHLIGNHGDGATYYNQTIIMPFWGAPYYMRKEGGTDVGPWKFWTEENDGAGSGLDADTLDGQHGAYYQPASTAITTSNIGSQSVSYAATAGSAANIDGINFRNGNSTNGVAPDNITDNGTSYTNSVSLFGQTDGALYSQAYSASWVHQIFGDYRTGNMAVRGRNNGVWQSWKTVWTSGNDGTGSGLDADLLDGQQGSYYYPASNPNGYTTNTGTVTSVATGGGLTGGTITGSGTISHADTSSQGSVNNSGATVIQDVTLDTYGHVTGLASKTLTAADVGALASGGKAADSNLLDGIDSSAFVRNNNGAQSIAGNLTVGSGTNSYIYMVDSDHGNRSIHNNSNQIGFLTQAGGWGSYCDDSGNWTAVGNVTAYSDERLKSNIQTIENAVDTVKALRGVTFEKDGKASLGVIAQEVQKVLPELVHEGDEYLSVAYGNMVGVLIEAIKEQQAQIDELKAKLEG